MTSINDSFFKNNPIYDNYKEIIGCIDKSKVESDKNEGFIYHFNDKETADKFAKCLQKYKIIGDTIRTTNLGDPTKFLTKKEVFKNKEQYDVYLNKEEFNRISNIFKNQLSIIENHKGFKEKIQIIDDYSVEKKSEITKHDKFMQDFVKLCEEEGEIPENEKKIVSDLFKKYPNKRGEFISEINEKKENKNLSHELASNAIFLAYSKEQNYFES